jgi:F-type H+-transporting ATPase subunit gamma
LTDFSPPLYFTSFLDAFKAYENEDDATKDLAEFSLANAIYAALVEGHACEQSAR